MKSGLGCLHMDHLVLFQNTSGQQCVFGKKSCRQDILYLYWVEGQRYQHQENMQSYNQMIQFMEQKNCIEKISTTGMPMLLGILRKMLITQIQLINFIHPPAFHRDHAYGLSYFTFKATLTRSYYHSHFSYKATETQRREVNHQKLYGG